MNDSWYNLFERLADNDITGTGDDHSLLRRVEQARREWLEAQDYYDAVSDPDLVDYAVHMMQAAEKKYMFLLKAARARGITSFSFTPTGGGQGGNYRN